MVLGQGALLTLLPLQAPFNPSPLSLICCIRVRPCSSQASVKMLLGQRAWGLSGPLQLPAFDPEEVVWGRPVRRMNCSVQCGSRLCGNALIC